MIVLNRTKSYKAQGVSFLALCFVLFTSLFFAPLTEASDFISSLHSNQIIVSNSTVDEQDWALTATRLSSYNLQAPVSQKILPLRRLSVPQKSVEFVCPLDSLAVNLLSDYCFGALPVHQAVRHLPSARGFSVFSRPPPQFS